MLEEFLVEVTPQKVDHQMFPKTPDVRKIQVSKIKSMG